VAAVFISAHLFYEIIIVRLSLSLSLSLSWCNNIITLHGDPCSYLPPTHDLPTYRLVSPSLRHRVKRAHTAATVYIRNGCNSHHLRAAAAASFVSAAARL